MFNISMKSDKIYYQDDNGHTGISPINHKAVIKTDNFIRGTKKIIETGVMVGHKMYSNITTGEVCIRLRGGKNWMLCGYVLSHSSGLEHTTWQLSI